MWFTKLRARLGQKAWYLRLAEQKKKKKTTYQFENDEQDIVQYERPLPSVSIGCNTEEDGTDGLDIGVSLELKAMRVPKT